MEKYAAEELNSTLCEFFAELRKANGDDYEPDSLRVMFSAIDRHLKSKSYPKSIREDNIFLPCRQVWEGKARKLRSEGKGKRPHRAQSLNAEEEEILWECGQLGTFTPESLTNTVFWLLIHHFGLRGRQQRHDMKMEDFCFAKDNNGIEFITFSEGVTKTSGQGLNARPRLQKPKMFSTGGSRCPVETFRLFMSRRPYDMINKGPVYLQAMKNLSGLIWYKRQPMGKDSINAIMKKMKKNSPLQELCPDKKLTNHSGRKTIVRKMKASGIPKCEIINITGHRHGRGLDPYDSGDENEQRFWSNVIDKVPFVPVTQSSSSISLPSSAVPQNQFQQV